MSYSPTCPQQTTPTIPNAEPSHFVPSKSLSVASVDSNFVDALVQSQGNADEVPRVMRFWYNGPHGALEAFTEVDSEARLKKKTKGKASAPIPKGAREFSNLALWVRYEKGDSFTEASSGCTAASSLV
ncbi:hypothetical protein AMTR_s00052p00104710 [Amborella trichopoda]|uniref:Uncharacterized protein n=1 Tax=Amborella trichopoda TaxID=13333 RepID=U5D7N8_AMBTC|nr:hypothetical protein AMTR_s00052p00104710 [Amborella trichopoda]